MSDSHLAVSPSTLHFPVPHTEGRLAVLLLTNHHNNNNKAGGEPGEAQENGSEQQKQNGGGGGGGSAGFVSFKVKTTAPKRYAVRPNVGIMAPGESTEVHIIMNPSSEQPSSQHKFQIVTMAFGEGGSPQDVSALLAAEVDRLLAEKPGLTAAAARPLASVAVGKALWRKTPNSDPGMKKQRLGVNFDPAQPAVKSAASAPHRRGSAAAPGAEGGPDESVFSSALDPDAKEGFHSVLDAHTGSSSMPASLSDVSVTPLVDDDAAAGGKSGNGGERGSGGSSGSGSKSPRAGGEGGSGATSPAERAASPTQKRAADAAGAPSSSTPPAVVDVRDSLQSAAGDAGTTGSSPMRRSGTQADRERRKRRGELERQIEHLQSQLTHTASQRDELQRRVSKLHSQLSVSQLRSENEARQRRVSAESTASEAEAIAKKHAAVRSRSNYIQLLVVALLCFLLGYWLASPSAADDAGGKTEL